MAHFAQLDSSNTVLQVIVVDNKDTAANVSIMKIFIKFKFLL